MKNDIKFFLIFVCVILIAGCREKFDPLQSTDANKAYYPDQGNTVITVLSPKEGDSFLTGSDLIVKWQAYGPSKALKVQLYKDDQYARLISLSTTDSSVLTWNIPNSLGFSNNYKIKIVDRANSDNYTFSPPFTIVQNN